MGSAENLVEPVGLMVSINIKLSGLAERASPLSPYQPNIGSLSPCLPFLLFVVTLFVASSPNFLLKHGRLFFTLPNDRIWPFFQRGVLGVVASRYLYSEYTLESGLQLITDEYGAWQTTFD